VSANSIEKGNPVQISWEVNNASSVSIAPLGPVSLQGSKPDKPTKTTTYVLTANGSTMLAEQTVEVIEPATPQPVVNNAPSPPKAAAPDASTLVAALGAYKGVFANASGKNTKDCQSALSSGKLGTWSKWCEEAKNFTVSEQSCSVGGSPEAPSLNCTETVTIRTKDGDNLPQNPTQKTFHFAKGSEGNWQLSSF
jgi:hypothetical protein